MSRREGGDKIRRRRGGPEESSPRGWICGEKNRRRREGVLEAGACEVGLRATAMSLHLFFFYFHSKKFSFFFILFFLSLFVSFLLYTSGHIRVARICLYKSRKYSENFEK